MNHKFPLYFRLRRRCHDENEGRSLRPVLHCAEDARGAALLHQEVRRRHPGGGPRDRRRGLRAQARLQTPSAVGWQVANIYIVHVIII